MKKQDKKIEFKRHIFVLLATIIIIIIIFNKHDE